MEKKYIFRRQYTQYVRPGYRLIWEHDKWMVWDYAEKRTGQFFTKPEFDKLFMEGWIEEEK